jgi:hypothetical protein
MRPCPGAAWKIEAIGGGPAGVYGTGGKFNPVRGGQAHGLRSRRLDSNSCRILRITGVVIGCTQFVTFPFYEI